MVKNVTLTALGLVVWGALSAPPSATAAQFNEIGEVSVLAPPPRGFPLVNGLVRRVDPANAKLTIKHDAIPNLGMPAMTMTYVVAEPSLLATVKAGDQIRFAADEVGGVLTLLWLEKK
jgi:Cu(I)/Ag(I) efflux system protein CusF